MSDDCVDFGVRQEFLHDGIPPRARGLGMLVKEMSTFRNLHKVELNHEIQMLAALV